MLGYGREDFIGLNVRDLVGETQANLHAQAPGESGELITR
jgi:hypothetical protein